ncbi:MAG: hypothetical protein MUQ65_12010 [Armatimonadetes bacterium]|nr:hypothetical protein [Armatimonadota bacterium]
MIDCLVVEDPGGRFIYADGASCITVQSCRLEKTDCPKTWESCRFKLDYAGRAPDLGAFE